MYELQNKRVLLTGGSGFLGSRVALRLLQEGARIRVLVRDPAKAKPLVQSGAEIIAGNMTDPAVLRQAVQECQVVFHFAGVLNEFKPRSYYHEVNVKGTQALAEAALESGIERFFHISTVYVYGMSSVGVIKEDSPHIPSADNYADTKLEAENIIQRLTATRGLPAVILQPSQVYGPQDKTWTLKPIELIRSGRMILVDGGKGVIQPIYIDDLVEGVLAAAQRGPIGETYILCGPQVISIREYFGYFARMLRREHIPSVPSWLAIAFAYMAEQAGKLFHQAPVFSRQEVRNTMLQATYDGSKSEIQLGFKPRISIEEGMQCIETWLRER
jgi:nucleoside-diphosphate-sugar epimerase